MMLHLSVPVIVEGKYDKIKIKSIVDATVLTTDGFGVFRNEEKRALIRRLGKTASSSSPTATAAVVPSVPVCADFSAGFPCMTSISPRSPARNAARPLLPRPVFSASKVFPPTFCAGFSRNSPKPIPNSAAWTRKSPNVLR